jgi:hypothetical protein
MLNKQYRLRRTDGLGSKSVVCQKWSGQTYILVMTLFLLSGLFYNEGYEHFFSSAKKNHWSDLSFWWILGKIKSLSNFDCDFF